MDDLIDDAVRVLRELPEDMQRAVARAIIEYGAGCDEDVELSDDQIIEIKRRMAAPDRIMLSLDETRARLRRHGA